MSSKTTPFSTLVPGFEFLKDLLGSTPSGLPYMGSWIAPTLDPKELDKRIEQLKTVQFWLEQNTRMLQTTIQALEVQRMTLSTLQSMNVPVSNVTQAFKVEVPEPAPTNPPASPPRPSARKARAKASAATPSAAGGVVDPMKWWGALTQQFADLASKALAEAPNEKASATRNAPATASATPAAKKPRAKPRVKPQAARI